MKFIFLLLVIWELAAPKPTYAYLDPGSGSLLIQLILGAILGSVYFVKLYWGKIIKFVLSLFGKKTDEKKNSK